MRLAFRCLRAGVAFLAAGVVPLAGLGSVLAAALAPGKALARSGEAQPPPTNWLRVETTGAWCGAKGLWVLARGFGLEYELAQVKGLCDPEQTSQGHVSLAALQKAATQMGLAALPVRCELAWLKSARVPALTVHRLAGSEGTKDQHCYVLLKYEDGKFLALDPFFPSVEMRLSDEAFAQTWTGEALLVARRPQDLPQPSRWAQVVAGSLAVDALVLVGLFGLARRRASRPRRAALTTVGLVALIVVGGCTRAGPDPAPSASPPAAPPSGPPYVRFERTEQEGGQARVAAHGSPHRVVYRFPFLNAGDRPVAVKDIKTSCSCRAHSYPSGEVPPGGKGEVTLVVDLTGRLGRFNAGATVAFDDPQHPEVELSTSDFVLRAPFTVPSAVELGPVVAGRATQRDVELYLDLRPGEQLPEIKLANDNPLVGWELAERRVKAGEADSRTVVATLRGTVRPQSAGREIKDVLTVAVGGRSPALAVPVQGWAAHPSFSVEPRVVNFGPVGPEGARQRVKAWVKGPGKSQLLLAGGPGSSAGAVARCERGALPGEWVVWVEARPDGRAFLQGEVALRLQGDDGPPYFLPYVGYAKE
jgi:hypothetical protein